MTFDLTIAGVPKELKAGTLSISQTANGRTTASFAIISQDRSYRPALDAEVIIEVDGTRIFGGLIERPSEGGFAVSGIVTNVSAVDFNAYAERRVVKETIPAGSLLAALTVLEPYLIPYGVSLDGGQVTGPALPELIYDYRPLTEVLDEISTLTGNSGEPYVWNIDAFKVLSMFQPSSVPAPFDLIGNNLTEVIGDIEVEASRDQYANRVIVKSPPKQEINRIERFTGDGTTYSFPLTYTPTALRYIVDNNGVDETLTWQGIGFDLAVQWLIYPPVSDGDPWTLRRETSGTPDPPAVTPTDAITITFDGTSPDIGVTAEDAGEIATYGPWEKVIIADSVTNEDDALTLAESYLAQFMRTPKTIRYRTWENGLQPGQVQEITVSARNISGDALITEVVTRDLVHRLEHTVTAISGDTKQGGWRDVYKIWAGDKTGVQAATAVSVGEGTPGGLPGGPNKAVQYNRAGAFAGEDAFTYDEATNSIVCGDLSSITAASPESCQVFGYDNHIADP